MLTPLWMLTLIHSRGLTFIEGRLYLSQGGYRVGSQFLHKRTKWTQKTKLWHRGRNVHFPLFPWRQTSIKNLHAYFYYMLTLHIRGSFEQVTNIWSFGRNFHGGETGHTISTYRRYMSLHLHLISSTWAMAIRKWGRGWIKECRNYKKLMHWISWIE